MNGPLIIWLACKVSHLGIIFAAVSNRMKSQDLQENICHEYENEDTPRRRVSLTLLPRNLDAFQDHSEPVFKYSSRNGCVFLTSRSVYIVEER